MQNLIEFPMAFLAGLLSFLSPCVLPLVPSYLAMLAGSSMDELKKSGDKFDPRIRNRALARSLFFALGFTIVFVVFGLIFSQAGTLVGNNLQAWTIAGGIIIILLGFNIIFDMFSFLNIEKRLHVKGRPGGFFSCLLFGAAFGAGWSPCVGPMLASILFVAGTGSLGRSGALLLLYSLGLALPFILAAFFFSRLEGLFRSIKKHMRAVKIVSGSLLVLIGLYMIFGQMRSLPGTFAKWGYRLESFSLANPFLSDMIFSLIYGVLFLACVVLRIRKRKKLKAEGLETKSTGLALLILGLAFGVLALLEACNVISTPGIIASWLRFQGI